MWLLLIVIVLGLWAAVLFSIGYFLSFPIKHKGIRFAIGVLVTVLLFTLPIRDELKGKEEFEALCKNNAVFVISPRAEGKQFDLKVSSSPLKPLTGYSRPVSESTIWYTDAATGEVMATGKSYQASGGWLVQHKVYLTSQTGPLLGRSDCSALTDAPDREVKAITNNLVK
jgi:hypothetical protein